MCSLPVLDATLVFVNHILSGMLPQETCLLDGLLFGMEKQDGGTRPIAVWATLSEVGPGTASRWCAPDVGTAEISWRICRRYGSA